MKTPTVVIELSNSAIKIVVGYVLNNEPVILYATTLANTGLIENGEITDVKNLATYLRNNTQINDPQARVHFSMNKVVLILPPMGLKVYENKQKTVVSSSTKQVTSTDITNVISMMCNTKHDENYSLVDIVPLIYYIDGGKTEKKPLQCLSSMLGMKSLLYTLPTRTIETYKKTFELANIRIQKYVISSNAIASLLLSHNDTPKNYLYIDIGSQLTTISLINKKHTYASITIPVGGDLLTKNIASAFALPEAEAEKLKRRYGYNTRVLSFNPVVYENKSTGREHVNFLLSDLNKIVKEYCDLFIAKINETISALTSSYPIDKRKFPIIVGGAGARLSGFLNLFMASRPGDDVRAVPLNVIGVRHERYLNAVGGLLADENNIDFIRYSQEKNNLSSRLGVSEKK